MDANEAAQEIVDILRKLPSPRHAAAAIAIVRANLHLQAGADTVEKMSAMVNDDDKAAIEIWQTIKDDGPLTS